MNLIVDEKYLVGTQAGRLPESHPSTVSLAGKANTGTIDDVLGGYSPMIQLAPDGTAPDGTGYTFHPDVFYSPEIRDAKKPYSGYPRSDLVNFVLDLNTNPVPFVSKGFNGVTANMGHRSRNTTTTRGDRTQELLTDTHELVFHVINKWSDNYIIGFYLIRSKQAAMFLRERDLPLDPYAIKGAYWN